MISSLSRQTRGRWGHAYPCVTRDTCPSDELQPLSRNWWKLENSSRGTRLGLGLELSKKYYHLSHCVNSCTKTSILTISSTVCAKMLMRFRQLAWLWGLLKKTPCSLIMRIVRCVRSQSLCNLLYRISCWNCSPWDALVIQNHTFYSTLILFLLQAKRRSRERKLECCDKPLNLEEGIYFSSFYVPCHRTL